MAWLDYSLLGTSEERQQLLTEQQEELQQCLEVDRRKEEARNELARKQKTVDDRLETVRSFWAARVPPEPKEGTSRVRIAVHHLFEGRLVRYFASQDRMLSVTGSVCEQNSQSTSTFVPLQKTLYCHLTLSAVARFSCKLRTSLYFCRRTMM